VGVGFGGFWVVGYCLGECGVWFLLGSRRLGDWVWDFVGFGWLVFVDCFRLVCGWGVWDWGSELFFELGLNLLGGCGGGVCSFFCGSCF